MTKYKRKTSRTAGKFSKEIIEEFKKLKEGGISVRRISRKYGIPESTIRYRLKYEEIIPTSLGRYKPVFTPELELELANHCRIIDEKFYGLTRKRLMQVAFEFAEIHGVHSRFNCEKRLAGKDWVIGFCQRQGLTLCKSTASYSIDKITALNSVQASLYFDNLKTCLEATKFPTHRCFNVDETDIYEVPKSLAKTVTSKGRKTICKVTSGEKDHTVTAICCMSASGLYVPPALIFPRKRMDLTLCADAPKGTLSLITDSGCINTDRFISWFRHFISFVKPTENDPVLLILDDDSSHVSLRTITLCNENHITLLCLPPHSSHKLQPLNVEFFEPLKVAYSREVGNWLELNPGKPITQKDVVGLFRTAYDETAIIDIAESAFAAAGVHPFNPNVISDNNTVPSENIYITDAPNSTWHSVNEEYTVDCENSNVNSDCLESQATPDDDDAEKTCL